MMQFKRGVFRCLGMVGSVMWLMSYTVQAADTVLLDPATLAVGTTLGEYLVVKESCPDPARTDCQATEKMKYISAVTGRTGKIEFAVNLTDNFELDVNVDWKDFAQQKTITLFKAVGDNTSSLYVTFYYNGGSDIAFTAGHDNSNGSLGWQWNNSINDVELSAKNGTAFLNINGSPFKDRFGRGDTVALDTSQPFVKLVIAGIKETDRLFEVTLKGGTGTGTTPSGGGDFDSGKQAGIQQCLTDPVSCGISVTSSGTGGTHANFNPSTGELYIPFVDVPGVFGGVQTYEVYLMQQPLTFTFDLDVNRVIPK